MQFRSRHGEDQVLWAIFERPDDLDVNPCLHGPVVNELTADQPEIGDPFRVLNLDWSSEQLPPVITWGSGHCPM